MPPQLMVSCPLWVTLNGMLLLGLRSYSKSITDIAWLSFSLELRKYFFNLNIFINTQSNKNQDYNFC